MNGDNLEFFKSLKVKGVSFDRRQDVIAKMDSLDRIVLKRERSNEYDGNAIAVYTIRNEQIGYIDREVSTELAAIIDEGRKVVASISKIIGGGGYHYGVVLDIYVERPKAYAFSFINDEPQLMKKFQENLYLSNYYSREIGFLQSVLEKLPPSIQCFHFISYYIIENYEVGVDFTWELINKAEVTWYETLLQLADFDVENVTPSHFMKLLLTDLYYCFHVKDVIYLLTRVDNGETGLEEDVMVMLQQSTDELARFFGNEFTHIYAQWELLVWHLKENEKETI
ncbi:HIRAN domain-containing protein [Neobacillus sp. 179-C4.2 HS]|uniref:HIRAN domain-containing protein n=1 Tax=Neobacillus driksii TaxID=3035913 RepID=A0ABV4YZ03_9BACI|nr:HIRAN domain-containing protein [Neobacillus sp. 179.-C4.2 HS]MDP5194630.1 HIRAN domain-containing protein [Neobacillus sp. 179.-C4.2 HS]